MVSGTVHQPTVIVGEADLSVDETSRIDSFCLINATGGVRLREQSVIHAGSHVVGSGGLDMGPRSVITYNCVVVTSTADLGYPASTVVPERERQPIVGDVRLERETFVGAGAVIMPGVTLHEGAVAGAHTYVDEDVPPWTVRYPDGQERPRERVGAAFDGDE